MYIVFILNKPCLGAVNNRQTYWTYPLPPLRSSNDLDDHGDHDDEDDVPPHEPRHLLPFSHTQVESEFRVLSLMLSLCQ